MLQIVIMRQWIPLTTGKSAWKKARIRGICNYSSGCNIASDLIAYRLAFRANVD